MDVLRRKMGAEPATGGVGVGAERAWRLALARAARDAAGVALEVTEMRDLRLSLAELVEMPAERALLALLDTGGEGLGLVAMEPAVLAGLVAMLTTGRVAVDAVARRPTRTDAAMVAPMLDAALAGLSDALAGQDEAGWAEGWRYASFLDEPRPLALLLEDVTYRVLRADVSLMRGAATGAILLALPATARARAVTVPSPDDGAFQAAFARQVEGVAALMGAELVRLTLPLSRIMALQVGEELPLAEATVARLVLRGVDGRALAEGRLGQMRGMRAIRLTLPVEEELRLTG